MFLRLFRLLPACVALAILPAVLGDPPRTEPLPDGALLRLGITQWRHGGAGTAIAFSPDGKLLLSGGERGTLRLWEVATGRELRRIPVQEKQVHAVAFAPDGKTVAAVGAEGRVCIHDAASGKELRTFRWTTQALYALAFSPDGLWLASAGHEGLVAVLDLGPKKKNLALQADGVITDLSYSPDGKALATAAADGSVRIWDVLHEHEVCRVREPQVAYRCSVFSPDGKMLAVSGLRSERENFASLDERLQLWDVVMLGERLMLAKPDTKRLQQLVADLDSDDFDKRQKATDLLEIYGEAARPALEKALTEKPPLEMLRRIEELLTKAKQGPPPPGPLRHNLSPGECRPRVLAFSRDGQTLAAAESDGIRFWNTRTGREVHRFATPAGHVVALAFSPDGKTLAHTDASGVIHLTFAADGAERWGPGIKHARVRGPIATITGVAFAPDGKTVASCSLGEKMVRLWDAESGKELEPFDAGGIYCVGVAFAADGKTLAAGGNMGGVGLRSWNTATHRTNSSIQTEVATWMFGITFAPDGKTVAAARWTDEIDGFIHRWETATGNAIGKPVPWRKIRSAPALFPDGKTVAVGSHDKTIRIRDAETGEDRHELTGHTDEVAKVVVSADGKYLASVGDWSRPRKDVHIWDAMTGKELHRLDLPSSDAVALAFSPDGKLLATAGGDGGVRVWKVATGVLHREFHGPAAIESLAFSPDGKRIAAGGADTTVLIWPVERNR
jgi:WD40 repeat protein